MMKKMGILLLSVAVLIAASGIAAAQSATSGTAVLSTAKTGSLKVYRWDCTSDASGDVVSAGATIKGKILKVVTIPSDGATSPTANYDVYLKDYKAYDVLGGLLINRSASAEEMVYPAAALGVTSTTVVVFDPMQLVVSAAGASRKFTVRAIVEE